MEVLTNLTPTQIAILLQDWNEGPHRALLLNRALYREKIRSLDELTGIRKDLKQKLRATFQVPALHLHERRTSADGTEKFVFALPDGLHIETVLIPDVGAKAGTRTLCLSTQAGCAMGCTFCFTAIQGLQRHLETWEIIEQVREIERLTECLTTHVVFMGMGEPLHNADNLLLAIDTLISPDGFSIAHRKVTVSTVGLLPQMKQLAKLFNVQIAYSLHAPNPALRKTIVPTEQKYPMCAVLEWLRTWPINDHSRFLIEYVLLDGVNNAPEHAHELIQTLNGLRCPINLIPYNKVPELSHTQPSQGSTAAFQNILRSAGLWVNTRRSRGADILGACGQLSGL